MKHLFLSFLLLLNSFTLLAQSSESVLPIEIEKELSKEIELKLKFNSLILETAARIDQKYPNKNFLRDNSLLEKELKENVEKYIDFYSRNFTYKKITQKQKVLNALKSLKESLNHKTLVALFQSTYAGIQTFFKKRGFGIAIAIFAGIISEYTVPIALYQIGLSILMPISPFIPYGTLYSLLPGVFDRIKIRNKLTKSLGGKKQYTAYMIQEKMVRERLKTKKIEEIILPVKTDGETTIDAFVMPKKGWFKSFAQKLGLFEKQLTLASLMRFLDENEIDDTYVSSILKNNNLKSYVKTALVTEALFNHANDNIKREFKMKFSKSFIQLDNNQHWPGLYDWMKKAMDAKSISEINEILFDIPRGLNPLYVISVWQDIILPHYADKNFISYTKYRKLHWNIHEFKAELVSKKTDKWNVQTHDRFLSYLASSMNDKSFQNCKNSHEKVILYLARKILTI